MMKRAEEDRLICLYSILLDAVHSEPNGDTSAVRAAAGADGRRAESSARAHRHAAVHRGHGGVERGAAAR